MGTLQQRNGDRQGALAEPTHGNFGKAPNAGGPFESLSGTVSCAHIARSAIDSGCIATLGLG